MEEDKLYTQHILESITKIETFIGGLAFDEFANNRMAGGAVVRELSVIGEAAKQLSEEFKEKHGSIPWKQIVGMRDKLIHDYFEVDITAVWQAVQEDLPPLKQEIEKEV